ncbi:MAG: PilZ domain-containing protein [Spirochaetales bacterium]|nr:PilZ domain-containing protein [Spirochaetales bacterium]
MIVSPVLLQLQPMIKAVDSKTIVLGIVLFAGFFLVLIIAGRVSGGKKDQSGQEAKPMRFRKSTFRKKATAIGLSKIQISTLENFMENYTVRQPYALLKNSSQLDLILKKALADIDNQVSSPDVKESQRSTIYGIKQVVERQRQGRSSLSGSKQISINQSLMLSPESGGRFPSTVVGNLRDMLAVQIPRNEGLQEIRWKRGTKLNVFFWKSNGQSYSFLTKVAGYNALKGTTCLLLQHSNAVKQAHQRRYRRKTLERPTYFYPVRILTMGTGRKQEKKAFVETKNGALGTILDISAGGCAVKTSYPLLKGSLIKVEFETEKQKSVAAFGKVKNMTRAQPVGGIMNIMFTRLSRKNLNTINAYIYELEKKA